MSVRRGRIWIMLAAATALVASAVATASASTAVRAAGAPAAAASASSPVYYMFRNPHSSDFQVRVDCVVNNPGCPNGHPDQSITLQTLKGTVGGPGNYVNAPVYATGAGTVHIGAIHTAACGPHAPSLGNWLWIDHGGGVVSRYAHLSGIRVSEGQHVTPRTQLAVTGNSGERSTCYVYYLNYQLKHGGVNGTAQPLKTLRACVGSTTVLLPTYQNHAWLTFNDVPKGTFLHRAGPDCVPA